MSESGTQPLPDDGRRRVVIEGVAPEIDGGRFPIKRIVGDTVTVDADVFGDGHDAVACVLRYRHADADRWRESALEPLGNDRWRARFTVDRLGRYLYTLVGWIDRFGTWRRDLRQRVLAGQDVTAALRDGSDIVEAASRRARGAESAALATDAATLRDEARSPAQRIDIALSDALARRMAVDPDRRHATRYERILEVVVDRARARFGAWYELFPRSASPDPDRHGTFRDVEARLPYIAGMGFDVLYLPPVHPIGSTHRKGRNNSPIAEPGDVGSPWAIGSDAGGHIAVHPELGTLDDFRRLVARTREYGIELALDLAFQASPDHPWVEEHPEWFLRRPDGTFRFAENPPKKYEDIYPFDFETEAWRELWRELEGVVRFWIDQGVRIFRVDNPHTKPFPFWEWLITGVKRRCPEAIFLSEAFTRPKVMYRLAKLGFTQSYTYFAWRNTKRELTEYLTELTRTEVQEYFRPSLWPNTPDILTEQLQTGGRPAFTARLVLAATLSASYGIYGPPFELQEDEPRERGGEEYADSEKYELRHWVLAQPANLEDFVTRVNRIRRENPALHSNRSLRFHRVDTEALIAYSKQTEDGSNLIVVVVNVDPHHTQSGWVELPLPALGLDPDQPYQVHDLLGDARFQWHGARNYVELNPHVAPAHVFRIRRHVRREQDFEYYM